MDALCFDGVEWMCYVLMVRFDVVERMRCILMVLSGCAVFDGVEQMRCVLMVLSGCAVF